MTVATDESLIKPQRLDQPDRPATFFEVTRLEQTFGIFGFGGRVLHDRAADAEFAPIA